MPARRRRNRLHVRSGPMPRKWRIVSMFFMLVVVVAGLVLYLLSSRAITANKYSVVYPQLDGSAVVRVYDFDQSEITDLVIPPDTYLDAAYGFGDWRVASLPKLGSQEGYGGELLRMTIVKNFHFPVDGWEDRNGYNSSLSVRERIQLALFGKRVSEQGWHTINLENTGYLNKTTLPDGEQGYQVNKNLPPEIATIFTTSLDGLVHIGIYDRTGKENTTVKNVSEVIHILGGDWAVVEQPTEDLDCIVRGQNAPMVERIAKVLACKPIESPSEGNFEAEIIIGKLFEERF